VDQSTHVEGGRKVINLAERRKQRLHDAPEPPSDGVVIPDFITPQTINEMTDPQLDQLLNLVRLRRMHSTLIYERTKQEKEQIAQTKARDALVKKAEQVWNELDKVFKNLDKLELRVNEMRALRLQAGLEF